MTPKKPQLVRNSTKQELEDVESSLKLKIHEVQSALESYAGNIWPRVTKEAIDEWWGINRPILMDEVRALMIKPRYWPTFIAGVLLGSVVVLAVIWTHPRMFMEPEKPTALLTNPMTSPAIPMAATTNPAISGDVIGPSSTDRASVVRAGPENPAVWSQNVVDVRLDKPCWVSVDDKDGLIQLDSFSAELPAKIRSGCPGYIHYFRDGEELHPDNLSKAPQKSEVVEIK